MRIDIEERIREIWGEQDSAPPICAAAQQFQQWTETLCTSVVKAGRYDNASAAVAVNQAKLLLLDKYFEWRAAVPKSHRNRTGEGHTCLYHVFVETYQTLRVIELSLTPPLLFLPPAPPFRAPKTLSIADVVSFGALLPGTPDE